MAKKVKLIQLTEKNFEFIASRIHKFFNGKDIVYWHNFDCGNKKHIQSDILIKIGDEVVSRQRTVYRYPNVRCTIVTPQTEPAFTDKFLRLSLCRGSGSVLRIGDWFGFAGNRLHVKTNSIVSPYRYAYDVFQRWDPNGGFKNLKPYPEDDLQDLFWDGDLDFIGLD